MLTPRLNERKVTCLEKSRQCITGALLRSGNITDLRHASGVGRHLSVPALHLRIVAVDQRFNNLFGIYLMGLLECVAGRWYHTVHKSRTSAVSMFLWFSIISVLKVSVLFQRRFPLMAIDVHTGS